MKRNDDTMIRADTDVVLASDTDHVLDMSDEVVHGDLWKQKMKPTCPPRFASSSSAMLVTFNEIGGWSSGGDAVDRDAEINAATNACP